MSHERLTRLAYDLLVLGVSQAGVERLFRDCEIDEIERQLAYLPYRHAKRPEAFMVDAVRHRYSAPKEFFYAATKADPAGTGRPLDEDPERAARPPDADAQGH